MFINIKYQYKLFQSNFNFNLKEIIKLNRKYIFAISRLEIYLGILAGPDKINSSGPDQSCNAAQ